MYSSIQDKGRLGYRKMGVPVGGIMDNYAGTLANRLLGNDPGSPILEFASPGPELEFSKQTIIVLTGADLKAKLNGRIIPMNEPLTIKSGSRIKFGRSDSMMWGYMGIQGQLDVQTILGSHGQTPGVSPKFRLEVGDTIDHFDSEHANTREETIMSQHIDYDSEIFGCL